MLGVGISIEYHTETKRYQEEEEYHSDDGSQTVLFKVIGETKKIKGN